MSFLPNTPMPGSTVTRLGVMGKRDTHLSIAKRMNSFCGLTKSEGVEEEEDTIVW